MIADVTCQASFLNSEAEHIDGFFLFPVEPSAALYHFEATIGGRKMVAATREKGEHYVSDNSCWGGGGGAGFFRTERAKYRLMSKPEAVV